MSEAEAGLVAADVLAVWWLEERQPVVKMAALLTHH